MDAILATLRKESVSVINNPQFHPDYELVAVDSEGIYLISERGQVVIKNHGPCAVASAIYSGTPSVEDLVSQDIMPTYDLYLLLARWEHLGYIRERGSLGTPSVAVHLITLGGLDDSAVRTALTAAGHTLVSSPPDSDSGSSGLTLVLTDDYLNPELAAINESHLASETPWLLARPGGQILWTGPAFRPGKSACWECLADRLRQARQVEQYLSSRVGRVVYAPCLQDWQSTSISAGMISDWVTIYGAGTPESIAFEQDLQTYARWDGTLMRHNVVRRPQCMACGKGKVLATQLPPPVVLEDSPKAFRADGGHRISNPAETITKYQHHISPITGAVTALEVTPTGDSPLINVVFAGHNLAIRRGNLAGLKSGLRQSSAGKGITPEQARASGLCEALERFSGNYTGVEFRRRGTMESFGDSALDPRSILHWSENQYANRHTWIERMTSFNTVPLPFDPSLELDWSPVWSFTENRHKWLPTQLLYYGYPFPEHEFFGWGDSNGNAAGNTLSEAIAQGFFELVERDAVAMWWYNRLQRPAVDLSSFDDPYIGKLIDYYRDINREVWALDLTHDLGIPVVAAVSRRIDRDPQDIVFAFGCHFDPHIAVVRALTEMNQFLPAVLNVDRDGKYAYEDPEAQEWWKTATIDNQPYLLPSSAPMTTSRDWVDLSTDDSAEDVRLAQRIVESKGMEFLVLDQTRPDIGLPVAKVIVPGLRHFWSRLGPGRLYTVPVDMGWIDRPREEHQLNPIAMFV